MDKGQVFTLKSSTDFAWSIGIRGIIWQYCNTTLGFEAQYLGTDPRISAITLQSTATANPSDVHLKYREKQVGLMLSQNIANLVIPYIGIKWSDAKIRFGDVPIFIPGREPGPALTLVDLKSSKNFGYAVGMTFNLCSTFDLTLEWRMLNEEAFYLNGQICF